MKTIITIVLLLGTYYSHAQSKITVSYSCSYYDDNIPSNVYIFDPDIEAKKAFSSIIEATGLAPNFKLVAGNVPNAAATILFNNQNKQLDRYIIYNQAFIYNIVNRINYWASVSIIAHEIGHHLNGHSLQLGGSRPELELEADKFSGFILNKLGASLNESQAAINGLVTEIGSSTHPPKSARLAAISNGWYQSDEKLPKKSVYNANLSENAKRLFTEKKYLEAAEIYEVIVKNPERELLDYFYLGSSYYFDYGAKKTANLNPSNELLVKAESAFSYLVQRAPTTHQAWLYLCRINRLLDGPEDVKGLAVPFYEKYVALVTVEKPDLATANTNSVVEAYTYLGSVAARRDGDNNRAKGYFDKVLKLAPTNAVAAQALKALGY